MIPQDLIPALAFVVVAAIALAIRTVFRRRELRFLKGEVARAIGGPVACEKCRTALHDGCWREHGRCPVLGCGGERPERARDPRERTGERA